MLLLSSANLFFKIIFYQTKFMNTSYQVSNSLGPDQDPNSLQRISADTSKERVKTCVLSALNFSQNTKLVGVFTLTASVVC